MVFKTQIFYFCLAIFFVAFFLAFALLPSNALAQAGTWWGFVTVNTTLASDGTPVTAYCNNTEKLTAGTRTVESTAGYYIVDIECNTGQNVTFKVCGVSTYPTNETPQNWSIGYHPNTTSFFNLTMTKLANDASCSYSCGCAAGYCCSGASEYSAGNGTGTCQSSACSSTTTTTVSGGGGGGGGGAVTTTTTTAAATTTTIPIPQKEETQTIENISKGETGDFNFNQTVITNIEVEASDTVTNPQITISQSSSQPATITIGAPNMVYGYLTITKTNLADSDISNVKIKFKVAKTWLSVNNIDESTIVLSRYSLGSWASLETTKTSDDGTYVYFEATSPGLSVFAITAEQVAITTTTPATTAATTELTTTTTAVTVPVWEIGTFETTVLVVLIILVVTAFVIVLYRMKVIKLNKLKSLEQGF